MRGIYAILLSFIFVSCIRGKFCYCISFDISLLTYYLYIQSPCVLGSLYSVCFLVVDGKIVSLFLELFVHIIKTDLNESL